MIILRSHLQGFTEKTITVKYDKPETPHKRIFNSNGVSEDVKEKLMKTYKTLNPLLLKRQIDKITQKFCKACDKKAKEREKKIHQEDKKLSKYLLLTKNDFIYNYLVYKLSKLIR